MYDRSLPLSFFVHNIAYIPPGYLQCKLYYHIVPFRPTYAYYAMIVARREKVRFEGIAFVTVIILLLIAMGIVF